MRGNLPTTAVNPAVSATILTVAATVAIRIEIDTRTAGHSSTPVSTLGIRPDARLQKTARTIRSIAEIDIPTGGRVAIAIAHTHTIHLLLIIMLILFFCKYFLFLRITTQPLDMTICSICHSTVKSNTKQDKTRYL